MSDRPTRVATESSLPIFTIGHSTRTLAEFVALLQEFHVAMLVDVRSIPRSRAVPQFNGNTLAAALAPYGIAYCQMPALGGRRHHKKGAPASANTYWRVAAFRDYADYAETEAFRDGLDELLTLARTTQCAVMCAEAVWWRCHRRIISDYILTRDVRVEHIMRPGHADPATRTPGSRLRKGVLRYPAPKPVVSKAVKRKR